jgi:hypothetical protein
MKKIKIYRYNRGQEIVYDLSPPEGEYDLLYKLIADDDCLLTNGTLYVKMIQIPQRLADLWTEVSITGEPVEDEEVAELKEIVKQQTEEIAKLTSLLTQVIKDNYSV